MSAFTDKLRLIATDTALRTKLFFVFCILVVFRLGANIPIPAVDPARLANFLEQNQFLGLLNVFSGGGLTNLSIFMLGVSPYITATIIMQLLTMIFPRLKEMYHEEGSAGRQRFMRYSRLITVPLAIVQAVGLLALLKNQNVIAEISAFQYAFNILIAVAGSMFLMWLGEIMSEYGIGNGVSLIIFAGIVSHVPLTFAQLLQTFSPADVPLYLGFLIVGVLIIAGVIIITEAERPIPITYAKQVRGMKMYGGMSTYLPLRVNQAGVIPIIFALSILLFPQIIVNFLGAVDNTIVQAIVSLMNAIITNLWFYGLLYFALVFIFTYFYTAVTFDPDSIANNLQKNGAFIPGIRPGQPTSHYISKILTRITLVGALFLGGIAVLPFIMQGLTGNQTLAIGGTSLLIVVSVVLDLVKRVDAQVSLREY